MAPAIEQEARRAEEALNKLPEDRQPIVISGPSGSGKSTMLNKLFKEHEGRFGFSVSREEDGIAYHFVTREKFETLKSANAFIESAQFGSNFYGTSFAAVEAVEASGKTCILDIEMEGVRQVARSHLKAKVLFLQPPSEEVLEKRLRGRGTDKEEDILKRLGKAKEEMRFAKSGEVEGLIVVNEDVDETYKKVEAFCLGQN